MRKETEHPFVEPRSFLERPYEKIEIGRMPIPPEIGFLRWLTTRVDETGLVLIKPAWYIIKASDRGVPTWTMPHYADVLVHSHPQEEDEKQNDSSVPSLRDFINSSPTAKNFIVSYRGITQYGPIEEEVARYVRDVVIFQEHYRFGRGKEREYLKYLDEINAEFIVHRWEDINETKLNKLFDNKI